MYLELCAKSKKVIETRDIHPKNIEILKRELSNVNWATNLSTEHVITENVDNMFNKCHNKVLDIIDKDTPFRKRVINEKKFRREPWVTPGILKCCKKQKEVV